MANLRLLQPVRYFVEPYRPTVERFDRPTAYRCDGCNTVTRYEKSSAQGPGPCPACGGSPAFLLPVKPVELDDFRLPPDLGGLSFEVQGESFPLCFGCNHYECWHREPTRTCGLGLRQHSYWSASDRLRIRPVNAVCWSLAV